MTSICLNTTFIEMVFNHPTLGEKFTYGDNGPCVGATSNDVPMPGMEVLPSSSVRIFR
jgi:hypothetical protein